MPKPTCVKCRKFMRPKENGVALIEGAPDFNSDQPNDDAWHPYKIWQADLWECRHCGAEILTGYSRRAKIRHEPGFEEELATVKEDNFFIVNDC